jgi:hypothetical protein
MRLLTRAFPIVGLRCDTAQRRALWITESDNWELELLCNVIASELLLPDVALVGHSKSDLDIDFLMEARRRWDVSTEALLRRYVAIAERPTVMLATSRVRHAGEDTVRVDYSDASPSFANVAEQFPHRSIVSDPSVFLRCVAVGQTARGTLIGTDRQRFRVQAVGAPAYPGSIYPRILALVEVEAETRIDRGLVHVVGDLLDVPPGTHPVLFAQVVSDSVRQWSRNGVAGALGKAFPDFAGAFRAWTLASPVNLALGNAHMVGRSREGRHVEVASIVAQEGYGNSLQPRLQLDAFERGLDKVAERAISLGAEVHIPRIGAGQAGGRWDLIEDAVVSRLVERGVRVQVHTLPSSDRQWRRGS